MFGIGPSELIFILVIALLVLGPKRLPELAAGLGKGLAEFRRATSDINAELDEARRSLEEQSREASRQAGKVSRTQRTTPRGAIPTVKASDVADEAELESEEELAKDTAKEKTDPDPKASA